MNYCGMDLGKKYTHICIVDNDRKVVHERKVRTRVASLRVALKKWPAMKIVLEASSQTFWLADEIEALGHEVIVVDPGRTKAIGSAAIKHDRLDARVLAELCHAGLLAEVYRPTREERVRRMPVTARDAIVKARTKLLNSVRSLLLSEGIHVGTGSPATFTERIRVLEEEHGEIFDTVQPMLAAIDALTEAGTEAKALIEQRASTCETAQLLQTTHGVGPIVAACFMAAIHDPSRFRRGRDVGAYLGLAPRLYSSGNKHVIGSITKRGNRQARWALTLAANAMLRGRRESALRTWAMGVAERRGRKTAVVALARRLAGVLWAMWLQNTEFKPNGVVAAAG